MGSIERPPGGVRDCKAGRQNYKSKKTKKDRWSDGHAVFAEVILLQALADVACGDSVDSAPSVRTEA